MQNQYYFDFSIDRGGTFTDIYCEIIDHLGQNYKEVGKLLSEDPANYQDAPIEGIRRIIEKYQKVQIPKNLPIDAKMIRSIRMGTTLATNALLERKGCKSALLITKGFQDLLIIGNQSRPNIFDLNIKRPQQIYQKVYEIDERVRIIQNDEDVQQITNRIIVIESGTKLEIIKEIEEQQLKNVLQQIKDEGFESIAVVLMHSYLYPQHEKQIDKIAKDVGIKQVSLSSEINPMIKIVNRGHTATADSYLNPLIQRYVQNFLKGFQENLDKNQVYFMQSDGGLSPIEQFRGSRSILSGPAGGVVGYSHGQVEDFQEFEQNQVQGIIGFDMGGTSTDVSKYDLVKFDHVYDTQIAGIFVQTPHLDVSTVAAGGGSKLKFQNGIFKVGPESVGAHPGPVCYGKGGELAVTDANLLLGRIIPDDFPKIFGPNMDQPLNLDLVIEKFTELSKLIQVETGISKNIHEVAYGYIQIASEEMGRAIRQQTQGQGIDQKKFVLSTFGGAGGQHACSVAQNLGINRVFIHKYAGILSAYGISMADIVRENQEPVSMIYSDNIDQVWKTVQKLKEKNIHHIQKENIEHQVYLNLRYENTDTDFMILEPIDRDFQKVFEQKYRQEMGFYFPEKQIIIDDIRVRSIYKNDKKTEILMKQEKISNQNFKTIDAYFLIDDKLQKIQTPVYNFDNLDSNQSIKGPAIIIQEISTIVILPQWSARLSKNHNLLIEKDVSYTEFQKKVIPNFPDPIELSIFSNRFMSIAEQMGKTLQRTSTSVNVKERLDFSCALFGPDGISVRNILGSLIANAPHLPVHLGSMQEAVKFQVNFLKDSWKQDEIILSNHPKAGGSHLPDMTVITPVFSNNKPLFYIASRCHHADIGGLTPGSMPPFSKTLSDEGVAIKSFKLVRNEQFQLDEVQELFKQSRNISDNISDLKAQVAANQKGINLLLQMIQEYGDEYVHAYMNFIQQNAEQCVRNMLYEISIQNNMNEIDFVEEIEYMDAGTPIKLKLTIDRLKKTALFDFEGTGVQVDYQFKKEELSNINCPFSVTKSAIIYCLRCLVNQEIPLNEGCLKPIQIKIPDNSILNPSDDAAVVGGNVLTSQRVTDVILKAFRVCGASQGCMNNFTFGNDNMGYYETIAGGSGAGPTWHGTDGVQTHMTNTRMTDPEIMEKRYPVLLQKFCLRQGSGGIGLFKGGNGVIREVKFLRPMKAAILSERRVFEPYGMNGGGNGAKGENYLIRETDHLVCYFKKQIIKLL